MERFKNHPTIFIQVKGMGFTFLIDTSSRYNLLAPCFADFFYEEYPSSREKMECDDWVNPNLPTQEKQMQAPLYLFVDVFQRKEGIKKIKCKDGISRGCEQVVLKFEHDNKSYSELFYVDHSLCSYCTSKNKISGILGINFLKKHKWTIDFSKLELRDD